MPPVVTCRLPLPSRQTGTLHKFSGRKRQVVMGSRRTTRVLICAIALVLVARVGEAQFVYEPAGGSVGNAATGENYVVEFAANLWTPTPDLVIASEALGIVGTPIDLVADLNVATKQLVEYRFVFRAGRKHKIRLHYLPINYSSSTILQASLVFNGIRYEAGVPIDVTLKWNAWRIGYQYDVVSRSRGFFGLILESNYTDIQTDIMSDIGNEFARVRAPVPTAGVIARGYVTRNVAVTAEFTGIALPRIREQFSGHFFDMDIYGTVNFTNAVGVQLGYHSMDLEFQIDNDSGAFVLKGWYFGGVVRF